MSTKLNAEELARARYTMPEDASPYKQAEVSILREGYIASAREVAQPIADERDELREALGDMFTHTTPEFAERWGFGPQYEKARAVLAKYPKP